MIEDLLLGFPGERPGGLALTIMLFVASGLAALLIGLAYATLCAAVPRASLPLQGAAAVLRGVPLILLVFLLAESTTLGVQAAGLAALVVYSFSHVGEILRSFMAAYPDVLRQQARVMGVGPAREWIALRVPRTIKHALDALATHWISLLKDTGALVVLSIGELTTVARTLSTSTDSSSQWATILLLAALLYLAATLTLIAGVQQLRRLRFARAAARPATT